MKAKLRQTIPDGLWVIELPDYSDPSSIFKYWNGSEWGRYNKDIHKFATKPDAIKKMDNLTVEILSMGETVDELEVICPLP